MRMRMSRWGVVRWAVPWRRSRASRLLWVLKANKRSVWFWGWALSELGRSARRRRRQ